VATTLPFADPSPASDRRRAIVGWGALSATILIWASFSLSIRAIGASPLTPADVALIRYGVPAVLLLPWLPSRLRALASIPWRPAAMIAIGAGLPFFLLSAAGGRLTSAAHVSALIAGTAPLAVALLGRLFCRQRIDGTLLPGLVTIVAGVALMIAGLVAPGATLVLGVALLLGASLLWGGYTLALRRVTLDPLGCVMLVTYPSLLVGAPLMAGGLLDSHLQQAPAAALLPFVLVQGVAVGIASTLTYAIAIRRLGALRCATAGSLAPVLAALLAVPLLGETPSLVSALGIAAITSGILLSNLRSAKGMRRC